MEFPAINTIKTRLLAVGAVLAVAAGLVFFYGSSRRSAPPRQTNQPPADHSSQNSVGRIPAVVAALAYMDLHNTDLPPEKTATDYVRDLGSDPEHLVQEVQKRVVLVPYEGSLNDPIRLLQTGVANSLDRARLLQTLLKASGTESRIVSVSQDGKKAFAQYAAVNPSDLPVMGSDSLEELGKEVAGLTPKILPVLKTGGVNIAAAKRERRLYWVQYQRGGAWTDLIPNDLTIDPAQRQTAQAASDEAIADQVWKINLKVINSVAHKEKEVLSFSAAAADLNGVALAYLNKPDGSLKKFVPQLLYGEKSQTGTAFELSDQGLDYQLLRIDVVGPYEQRHFVRMLVFPNDDANPDERGLEVATVARITVVCGPVSDEQFQRSLVANLSQAGRVLFGKANDSNSAPLNPPSIPAIAVLDASQRYAGRSAASANLLAFQGRPALAVEHDYVVVSDNSLVRRHSFDLVDPGHALYAGAPTETLLQAAVEQSVVDAWMEDRVTQGANVVTSRRAVRDLLDLGTALSINKQLGLENDNFGTVRPVYRLGRLGQSGTVAGWRLDPGPQVVPVLGNLTGGTQADMAQRARVQKFCNDTISWSQFLVPTESFPQKFMLLGIVSYDCKLAETYYGAANALDAAFAPLDGGASDSGQAANDLKKQIEQLGPELIKNTAKNAIDQIKSSEPIRGIKQYIEPVEQVIRAFREGQDGVVLDNALSGIANSASSGTAMDTIEQQAANELPR